MKVHIGYCKHKEKSSKILRGIAVYDNSGNLLNNIIEVFNISNEGKFDEALDTLLWGIKKFRTLLDYEYKDVDVADFFIESKTVYGWFEKECSPPQYIKKFSDAVIELSFINLKGVSINHTDKVKINFSKNTDGEENTGISEFFDKYNSNGGVVDA